MPALKTEITEIVTGLAMFGFSDLRHGLGVRPPGLRNVGVDEYERLESAYRTGTYANLFERAWRNGSQFAASPEGLRGRPPWVVEWKGGHRPPGYEQIPADLRVDHVYLVSCKYGSNILTNSSPSNLFDRLLSDRTETTGDWFAEVAGETYQAFYEAVRQEAGADLPTLVTDLEQDHREILKRSLPRQLPGHMTGIYGAFAEEVAIESSARWAAQLKRKTAREQQVWRLLRLQSAPYFVLGESADGQDMRYRVSTPWDLRERYNFMGFEQSPDLSRGQPVVQWTARFKDRLDGRPHEVNGHVEIRWSHGRFAQVPEAKVYLDTPQQLVPGYVPVAAGLDETRLFDPAQRPL